MKERKKFDEEGYVEDLIERAKFPFFENLPYPMDYAPCRIRALFMMSFDAIKYHEKKHEEEIKSASSETRDKEWCWIACKP